MKRVELSCHTYFSPMDGVLSPEEWVNIAWKGGVRALAVTDFQDVQAFWKTAHAVEKLRRKVEPEEVLDFKALYGLETVLEDGCLVHLLVRNQAGLEQLYRLLEIAWEDREPPFLRKEEISKHRTGLLVGCPGEDGELYRGIRENLNDAHLEKIAGFYDYLSVLRPEYYRPLSIQGHALCNEVFETQDLILKTITLGKRLGKPVAAAGNARVASVEFGVIDHYAYRILKDVDQYPVPDLSNTEKMLDSFSFLEKELAEEIVLHAPDRLADLCEEIRILPEDERCLQPILPGAFETVADLCREQLEVRCNGEIPGAARERLEYELAFLQNSEVRSSALLMISRLVQELHGKGHLVAPRVLLASSYAAYLLGITEVDPLALHIPCEPLFFGDNHRFLHLDLNVSDECWEDEDAAEILSQVFPNGMIAQQRYEVGISFRHAAAMMTAYAAKYKKNWDGEFISECIAKLVCVQCGKKGPFRREVLVPDTAELRRWLPVQKIGGEDMIPDGLDIHGHPTLFRLFWYGIDRTLSLLHRLEELTGIPQSSINMEEAVPLLLQDQTDIPTFGIPEVQTIWRLAKPRTMEDIVKISSLAHSTGAWEGNAEELLREGSVPFREIIGSRDDVFNRLLDAGLDRRFAYRVMEDVRKGKGLDGESTSILIEYKIPTWFINSCNKILYLFPKAHCAAIDAVPALKAAWYKARFPKEYAQAYAEPYADEE